MTRTLILMRVSDHNFVMYNSDRPRGKRMYVTGVCFFVIDKMACGMVRVRWSDIIRMAHLSTMGKTGN